jgi:geranylgeranyl reductase family protein
MDVVDVAIVGGGPAGSICAAFCAAAGLRTMIIEREKFPREKVCGDCINPACWPVLHRLGVFEPIRALPHGKLDRVEFAPIAGDDITIDLPAGDESEIAIKRSLFDNLLLNRARDVGAEIREESIVTAITRSPEHNWKIDIVRDTIVARILVGADGRNSTVARLCNLLPRPTRERVALQAHVALPSGFGNRIVLQFLPEGYSGQAPVNDRELNLCLVGKPSSIAALRRWAEKHFAIPGDQQWRTITPLTRAPIRTTRANLFFIGDAARVVEPFTGEGIYYALRSGELAAEAITKLLRGDNQESVLHEFNRAYQAMYRGRLWINQLARTAVLSPRLASALLRTLPAGSIVMRFLTGKTASSQ